MVTFVGSVIVSILMTAAIVWYGKRRPVGSPLSWGEAMFAATYVFLVMFWVYGVVPHQWLAWADNELGWRSDKIGIPLGPLGVLVEGRLGVKDRLLFPEGVPLPNGHFIITAQVLRDIIAAGLYIVFLLAQIKLWLWWQKRDKKKADTPELTSAYGRPLVRGG